MGRRFFGESRFPRDSEVSESSRGVRVSLNSRLSGAGSAVKENNRTELEMISQAYSNCGVSVALVIWGG